MICSKRRLLTIDQRVIWSCPFELSHGSLRENARRLSGSGRHPKMVNAAEDGMRSRAPFFIFSGAAT